MKRNIKTMNVYPHISPYTDFKVERLGEVLQVMIHIPGGMAGCTETLYGTTKRIRNNRIVVTLANAERIIDVHLDDIIQMEVMALWRATLVHENKSCGESPLITFFATHKTVEVKACKPHIHDKHPAKIFGEISKDNC